MLPKPYRIPSRFLRGVMRQKERIVHEGLELKMLKTTNEHLRCTIVVSTRIDKRATTRNRMRRLISESVRHLLSDVSGGYDVVLTLRSRVPDSQTEVDRIVRRAFVQARILSV